MNVVDSDVRDALAGHPSTDSHPHRSEVAVFSFGQDSLLAPTGPLSDVERGFVPEGRRRQHET